MVIIFSPHILSLNIVCFSVFETKTFKDFSLFNPLTCKNSTPIVAPLYSLGFESILPGMIPLSHKFNLFCYGQMVFKIIFKDFFYLILFKISPPPRIVAQPLNLNNLNLHLMRMITAFLL